MEADAHPLGICVSGSEIGPRPCRRECGDRTRRPFTEDYRSGRIDAADGMAVGIGIGIRIGWDEEGIGEGGETNAGRRVVTATAQEINVGYVCEFG